MKTTLHICAVVLASTLLVPPEATAARGGDGTRGFTFVDPCASGPTVEQCQDPAWLNKGCGLQEKQRLENDPANAHCAAHCDDLEPTLAACESDVWISSACGQLEAPRWLAFRAAQIAHDGGDPGVSADDLSALEADSQCATAAIGEAPVSTQAEVVLPEGIADDDGRRVVNKGHYGREGQYYIGGTSHYQGHVMREWTRASSDAPGNEGGSGWFTPALADALARMSWDDNGVAVASCREYVYERFYDYSLFEDAIMGAGDDYRAIFEVAYDDGIEQVRFDKRTRTSRTTRRVPRSAIGTRGIDGTPQMARDNALLEPQITFPGGMRPKSSLYRIGLITAEERADAQAAYDLRVAEDQSAHHFQGSCGSTLDGPVFCDATLYQDLLDGADIAHPETWAYHKQMSDDLQAAGFLDEELARGDQRVQDFEQLLFRRSRAVKAIVLWWKAVADEGEAQLPDEMAEVLFDPSVQMGVLAGDPISSRLADQRGVRLRQVDANTMGVQSAPSPDMQWQGEGQVMFAMQAGEPQQSAWAVPPPSHDLLAEEPGLMTPEYLEMLWRRLHRVDAEIEQALLDARDAGCIEADAVTPCDWSPRLFAQRVVELYGAEREEAYQHCSENIPEGFARLAEHNMAVQHEGQQHFPRIEVGGALSTCFLDAAGAMTTQTNDCEDCNDWTQSTTHVERYFRCMDAQKQLILDIVLEVLGKDAITADRKLKLQGSSGDSTRLGNDNFNITSAYGFGWALGEFQSFADSAGTGDRCLLRPEAYAHFDVDATALFFSKNLVHAAAHARLGDAAGGDGLALPASVDPNRLEVELLGIEVVGADMDLGWDDGFNLVQDEWSEGGTMISAGATFTIGFIPVTISGGVAGRIGVEYTVDFDVPAAAQATCDLFALTGKVSPYAGIEAFASATVNALVAEAGVKVYLTLLRIDLPFTVGLTLALDGLDQLSLRMTSSLDLVVSFLSGRVAAYLRVLWEEWEATIFSWNGPRFTKNLMATELEMPIMSLKAAAEALDDM